MTAERVMVFVSGAPYGEPVEVARPAREGKLLRAERTETHALRYALREKSRRRQSGLSINIPITDGVPVISRNQLGRHP